MYNPEFADVMAKYIAQIEHDGHMYFVLNMEEYGLVQTYRMDKYSILEIFQDIDIENKKHNKNTNYFEKFSIVI
jgi:hypothetical protein